MLWDHLFRYPVSHTSCTNNPQPTMTNSHHTTPLCGNNPSYFTTAQISRSQPPSVIGQNVFVLMRQLHIVCHHISQALLPIQQEMSYVCPSDEICNPNGLLHMVAGCPSTHHHISVARLARPMIPTYLLMMLLIVVVVHKRQAQTKGSILRISSPST